MSRDKQIEEMAKALTTYEKKLCDRLPKDKCLLTSAVHAQVSCDYCKIAEFLVNAGYRKASDVAEKIFAEVETSLVIGGFVNGEKYIAIREDDYNHYKKKYTEGGE